MRIAQVSADCSRNGGVGAYLLRLSRALADAGHEVGVVHGDARVSARPPGVREHLFVRDFHRYEDEERCSGKAAEVMRWLDTFRPDVVHFQGNNNFVLERECRERWPALKTLHVYDYCPSGNKFHHLGQAACVHPTSLMCVPRMVYRRCLLSKRPTTIWWHYTRAVDANRNNAEYATLVVASNYVKEHAIRSGYPSAQVEVVPYFTDLPARDDDDVHGTPIVLCSGRLVREKGLRRLIEAMTRAHTPARLVVSGDGPELPAARVLARRRGVDAEFLGWVEAPRQAELYRQASVVAVPSIWPEPFGMVGIEAMSHARPVVAFDVGGIREWLDDGVTGYLAPVNDVTALAERLDRVLGDPTAARAMGIRGRARVEVEFTTARHLDRLLGVYERIRQARRPAA